MGRHLRRWGAVYVLAGLFLGSWAGQLVAQAAEFTADAHAHGQPFTWADFWPGFAQSTLENWQSEFLQLLVQAVLLLGPVGYLLWQADQNADKTDVARLEAKLDTLLDGRPDGRLGGQP